VWCVSEGGTVSIEKMKRRKNDDWSRGAVERSDSDSSFFSYLVKLGVGASFSV